MNANIARVDSRTRHPELYSAPDRIAAEDEVAALLATLVFLLKPDRVLEVGTAQGFTAWQIGTQLEINGVGHLDTVEMGPTRAQQARERLKGLPVTVINSRYQDHQPTHAYQLAFFDAKWTERREEFLHYQAWLEPGCTLVFHDCGDESPGRPGVDQLEAEGLIKSIFLPVPRGLCLAEKL